MLFDSSLRRELAGSFSATLVALITVVVTVTLIRVIGDASRNIFSPADVLVIMAFTVLSDAPTILSLSMFIAVTSVITRMYRESEMVIWLGTGKNPIGLVKPVLLFAWPILVTILVLAILVLPWTYGRIEDLRDKFEKRGEIARFELGKFQEFSNGNQVFFIETDGRKEASGKNVFLLSRSGDSEMVAAAQSGHLEEVDGSKYMVLDHGQRLQRTNSNNALSLATFEKMGIRLNGGDSSARNYAPTNSLTTLNLLADPSLRNQGELVWRGGLVMAAVNLLLLALAAAGANPRVGSSTNFGFALLAFVVYFNCLILAKNGVETGQYTVLEVALGLHGTVFACCMAWLLLRSSTWQRPRWSSAR
jgi:lipopolysaccharide export system permease protein